MVDASDLVFRARVLSVEVRPYDGPIPVATVTKLAVDEYIKGQGPTQIELFQPGGALGEVVVQVEGNAVFTPGESVLLITNRMRKTPSNLVLTGSDLSAFHVTRGFGGALWAIRADQLPRYRQGLVQETESSWLPMARPLSEILFRIRHHIETTSEPTGATP